MLPVHLPPPRWMEDLILGYFPSVSHLRRKQLLSSHLCSAPLTLPLLLSPSVIIAPPHPRGDAAGESVARSFVPPSWHSRSHSWDFRVDLRQHREKKNEYRPELREWTSFKREENQRRGVEKRRRERGEGRNRREDSRQSINLDGRGGGGDEEEGEGRPFEVSVGSSPIYHCGLV